MKVLIFGFPRSGTSLTYRLFKKHKDVMRMYYESLLLWRHQGKKIANLFPGLGREGNAGEKIIYEKPFIGKTKTGWRYIDYCDEWNKRFGKEARIIQIVRHPYDQWNSVILKKYIARRTTDVIPRQLKNYFNCVPEYTKRVFDYPNSLSIKYEELTTNPEFYRKLLYTFCGLDPKRVKSKEKIRTGKTFWYKENGHRIDTDSRVAHIREEYWKIMNKNIQSVLDVYNEIPGVEYRK